MTERCVVCQEEIRYFTRSTVRLCCARLHESCAQRFLLSYDGQEPIRCMCCRAALDEAQCMAIVLAAPLKLMCEVLAKRIRGAAERAAHEQIDLEAMQIL